MTKRGSLIVFEYLFAKKNRANIDEAELRAFRKLSSAYASLTGQQLAALLENGNLTELSDGNEDEIPD